MGIFSRLKKSGKSGKNSRSAKLIVAKHELLTAESARITFTVPEELKSAYDFIPGQYLNLHCEVDGAIRNRSYSICSAPGEPLAVASKAIPAGQVSNWLVNVVTAGHPITVDFPQGNFVLDATAKKHLAFAAGSGITPILSMAKSLENTDSEMTLFYGNARPSQALFLDELAALSQTKTVNYFSRETHEGSYNGRFDKQIVSEIIKSDLSLLRADAFYICGPEEMIIGIKEVLQVFGIKPEQIHYELFTTPVLLASNDTSNSNSNFKGTSQVTAFLDGEQVEISLHTDGKTVLDALDDVGLDVPYSCKGGVCCTCKAKILEGTAKMNVNFALTDEEVKQGYILTCQAHPTSEILKLDFDA